MSLADKINSAMDVRDGKVPPANVCSLCWLIDQIEEADRIALVRAVESTMTGRELSEVIADEGYVVSDRSIQRHRRSGHNVSR